MDALRGVVAFVGIGSNLGDSLGNCRRAIAALQSRPSIRWLRGSSLYRTEPWGGVAQNWFVNAVAEVRTTLTAADLVSALLGIERDTGRRERGIPWGPREMDLDLLLYGQEVIRQDGLSVPHPELHRRRFVLVPLAEIAPYAVHPAFGVSVAGLLQRLEDPCRVERLSPPETVEMSS